MDYEAHTCGQCRHLKKVKAEMDQYECRGGPPSIMFMGMQQNASALITNGAPQLAPQFNVMFPRRLPTSDTCAAFTLAQVPALSEKTP